MFQVGETVRVRSVDNSYSRKAVIAVYNDIENTFDVIYSPNPMSQLLEENSVHHDRISSLLTLETSKPILAVEDAKIIGNELFSMKDYESAEKYYRQGIDLIMKKEVSIGSRVLISSCDSNTTQPVKSAVVSSIDSDNIDVMYDFYSSTEEEDDTVKADRVMYVESDQVAFDLQRALYMNLAKCSLKLNHRGWAIRWSTFAISILLQRLFYDGMTTQSLSLRKSLADAYYVRATILLKSNRPNLSKKVDCSYCDIICVVFLIVYLQDAMEAIKYEGFVDAPQSISGKYRTLMADIDMFVRNRNKENRALARNIAAWVNEAVATNAAMDKEIPADDLDDEQETNCNNESKGEDCSIS
jgi:tetratricopeptide (TPR) repeat protein